MRGRLERGRGIVHASPYPRRERPGLGAPICGRPDVVARAVAAIQIKLDDLIRAPAAAQNALRHPEAMDARLLDQFRARYPLLAKDARGKRVLGQMDAGTPEP